eukprot:365262-Chlamydomonas_euryale.AAC.7
MARTRSALDSTGRQHFSTVALSSRSSNSSTSPHFPPPYTLQARAATPLPRRRALAVTLCSHTSLSHFASTAPPCSSHSGAPFHRAFAPFAICVGPAHSNVHPNQRGLSRTLHADAIPRHSGVAGDSFEAIARFNSDC